MFKDISSGVLEREVTRGIGSNEIPQRVLGKTGESVPVLGLGSAPGADAIALYHKAIDRGVTYIDTATGYGRAQAQLGEVMGERREEVFLVTKTHTEDGAKALEILEQNMRLLQTDQVDLTYVHAVGGLDVDRVLGKDGSLAGLRDRTPRRSPTSWTGSRYRRKPRLPPLLCVLRSRTGRLSRSAPVPGRHPLRSLRRSVRWAYQPVGQSRRRRLSTAIR